MCPNEGGEKVSQLSERCQKSASHWKNGGMAVSKRAVKGFSDQALAQRGRQSPPLWGKTTQTSVRLNKRQSGVKRSWQQVGPFRTIIVWASSLGWIEHWWFTTSYFPQNLPTTISSWMFSSQALQSPFWPVRQRREFTGNISFGLKTHVATQCWWGPHFPIS